MNKTYCANQMRAHTHESFFSLLYHIIPRRLLNKHFISKHTFCVYLFELRVDRENSKSFLLSRDFLMLNSFNFVRLLLLNIY